MPRPVTHLPHNSLLAQREAKANSRDPLVCESPPGDYLSRPARPRPLDRASSVPERRLFGSAPSAATQSAKLIVPAVRPSHWSTLRATTRRRSLCRGAVGDCGQSGDDGRWFFYKSARTVARRNGGIPVGTFSAGNFQICYFRNSNPVDGALATTRGGTAAIVHATCGVRF